MIINIWPFTAIKAYKDTKKAAYLLALDATFVFNNIPYVLKVSDYKPDDSDIINYWQKQLDTTKTWAKTLEDSVVRKAYLHWLAYWQRKLDDSYDKNIFLLEKQRNDNYDKMCKEDDRLRKSIVVPKPPNLI